MYPVNLVSQSKIKKADTSNVLKTVDSTILNLRKTSAKLDSMIMKASVKSKRK